ncbi:unnamed protein product [Closterium sp. Naga37s-1]|nr:unnamed protein product [Closterium sp. Naga37s-1]
MADRPESLHDAKRRRGFTDLPVSHGGAGEGGTAPLVLRLSAFRAHLSIPHPPHFFSSLCATSPSSPHAGGAGGGGAAPLVLRLSVSPPPSSIPLLPHPPLFPLRRCRVPLHRRVQVELVEAVLRRCLQSPACSPRQYAHTLLVCSQFCDIGMSPAILRILPPSVLLPRFERWSDSNLHFLRSCAAAGNSEALFILGMTYTYCFNDPNTGSALLTRAARDGHVAALHSLAIFLLNRGNAMPKRSCDDSSRHRDLVTSGNQLAHCVQHGVGARSNERMAHLLLARARALQVLRREQGRRGEQRESSQLDRQQQQQQQQQARQQQEQRKRVLCGAWKCALRQTEDGTSQVKPQVPSALPTAQMATTLEAQLRPIPRAAAHEPLIPPAAGHDPPIPPAAQEPITPAAAECASLTSAAAEPTAHELHISAPPAHAAPAPAAATAWPHHQWLPVPRHPIHSFLLRWRKQDEEELSVGGMGKNAWDGG